MAAGYDRDRKHAELARRLIAAMGPIEGSVLDVACGTGQVAGNLPPTAIPVLALDASAGMITHGRERHDNPAIRWRTAPAIPLPVPDGTVDVILCSSALHFLGRAALADWRRALGSGGRVGYTLPLQLPTPGPFATLLATDLPIVQTAAQAQDLAESAGFIDVNITMLRDDIITTARTPEGSC